MIEAPLGAAGAREESRARVEGAYITVRQSGRVNGAAGRGRTGVLMVGQGGG
jgi:hypothetical protein